MGALGERFCYQLVGTVDIRIAVLTPLDLS